MLVNLSSGRVAYLIGDPHLGKSFEVGVPLDRRGEREVRQMQHFKRELEEEADFVVIMGDLFDHPYVGFGVVQETYKALVNAAAAHPQRTFIVLAGNHDMPRNLEAIGAFDMLETLCHLRADNLRIASNTCQIGPIACFPWKWHMRADEQQVLAPVSQEPVELVVGHWDLQVFEGNDSHLAPVKMLRERYGDVPLWSGHYHIPGEYIIDGDTVNCTGSMEPYSHGEDPEGHMYVTLTPAEIELAAEHGELRNKCVRVLLRDGEEMPTGVDCLAMTPKRVSDEETESAAVLLGDFNWNEILQRKLGDLPKPVREFIEERLRV